ncbi:cytochrome P450 [Lentinus tigrinus ALCF2SS1-7]|uniref:Cytochrome P450 n=1 Tax=Lentinus tigrinus ALCF2SS1-6 TaxID=1328759 RepID=A0A5C2RV66_9APHY|nr:cytochrome P450 [Lentinus tigrinus ALCF2SS1-6]RPD74089.1 cytochrome P450 [Lentinus tigrinus ALCF2SS1-7]
MVISLWQGAAICGVSWLLWKYFRQLVVMSSLDNVPGPPSRSFLYGNLKQLLDRRDGWSFLRYLTDSYPGVVKLNGPLGRRMLYVFDPTAMHNIIVKDQYVFEESEFFIKSNRLFFGPGLLGTLGEHHRRQRKLLNPAFSIAHMRRMIPIFNVVGHKLVEAIEGRVRDKSAAVELDMLSWMGRTALELIGQAGLGYSFDPLVDDTPADQVGHAIKAFQPTITDIHFLRRLLPYVTDFGTPVLRRKLLELVPNPAVQKMKDIVDTIWRQSEEIYESKKRALEQGDEAVAQQIGEGKDLMSILLQANMNAAEEDRLPEEELLGQMSTFIFAAMDTTSNALSMTLFLLAQHPEVQEKLRQEILEAAKGEDLGYDTLVSLPYLDAVCRETLRLHAPVAQVFRDTREDAVLPLSQPVRGLDGKMMHEILVPKDTVVVVGLLSSNQNKQIWGEDALEWKPERWLSPLPESVTEAKIPGVYSNLMTFLGGGRACIGFKFSQLEMKVVLCLLLSKFTFELSSKPIFWNFSGIRYPSVGDASNVNAKPSLPMRVGLYKRGST